MRLVAFFLAVVVNILQPAPGSASSTTLVYPGDQALSAPLVIMTSHTRLLRESPTPALFRTFGRLVPRRSSAFVLQATLLAALNPFAIDAQSVTEKSTPKPQLSGWLTYFRADANWKSVERFGSLFSEIKVFALSVERDGTLTHNKPFVDDAINRLRHLPSTPVISTVVTNDQPKKEKDSALVHRWTSTPAARAKHIGELVEIAKNSDGLTLDYENISQGQSAVGVVGKVRKLLRRPGTKDDGAFFTQFVRELAAALHEGHKSLVVTLEDKTRNGPHPLDYAALAANVDVLELMAYHYHGPNTDQGAISPPDRVQELAASALKAHVPASKLRIILPAFGFSWINGSKKNVTVMGSQEGLDSLTRENGSIVTRDPQTRSAIVHYWTSEPVFRGKGAKRHVVKTLEIPHTVWFEDGPSIAYKIERLRNKLGLHEFGLWYLGAGADVSALLGMPPTIPPKVPTSVPLDPLHAIPFANPKPTPPPAALRLRGAA